MDELASRSRAAAEWTLLSQALHSLQNAPDNVAETAQSLSGVSIFSGFLGAGKTTLLRRILTQNHGLMLGVIVNDFGAINLDAAAIREVRDGVVELTNGCSCCSMGADFDAALDRYAAAENPPQALLVEASGVADPVALATSAGLRFGADNAGIVTLVDAGTFSTLSSDPSTATLFRRQIEAAHFLVLTKVNTLPAARVEGVRSALSDIAPGRMIIDAAQAHLTDVVFSAAKFGARPSPLGASVSAAGFVTCCFSAKTPVDPAKVKTTLSCLPQAVFRVKGHFVSPAGKKYAVQSVTGTSVLSEECGQTDNLSIVVIGSAQRSAEWQQWLNNAAAELGWQHTADKVTHAD